MKRNHVLSIILLVLLLIVVPMVAACGGEEETTTTAPATETTAAGEDLAAAADEAIAAVTKSSIIETPPTMKEGVLQGGSDTAFPPMEFSDEQGGYIGFDVDLCTALAKKMGLELEVVSTAWDGIIPALLSDRYDIIMSAMSITEERKEQVNFTNPYLPGILAISAPIDKPVMTKEELVGKTVGVQVDTTGQFAIEEMEGIKEIKKYATILEAFMDMAAGRVECVVNDEPVNAYIIQTNTDYQAKFANTGGIVTVNDYGYAIKKENTALLEAMNLGLTELINEGVYQKICKKWGLTGIIN
ncbi:MAG: basic amino acid ABC transporter substrate-binding protein [Actinobacteria bacterium]|nr:basic amino acid ABC transporter substrate-binding protein [Actinomycetota bacterium]